MVKVGLGLDEEGNEGSSQGEPQFRSPHKWWCQAILRCIQSLRRARQCHDANCPQPSCQKMKRAVQHTKGCQHKTNGSCGVCKQFIALCCYHAKHCQENMPHSLLPQHQAEAPPAGDTAPPAARIAHAPPSAPACASAESAFPHFSTTPPPTLHPTTPWTPQPPTLAQPSPVSVSLAGFSSMARTQPPTSLHWVPAPPPPAQAHLQQGRRPADCT